ncbi:MAG: glucose-1-phosphate thymidylyltransferase, partial [Candidatus Methanomethylophilaceae archaeon]|nr:glucose-1-phosphate thymidylyltransferase [Candidatus Methanomethylophilaceae archaeon]
EILIITNEKDIDNFKRTLGDGSQFGISIEYDIQYVQRGISDAFIIAEKWIGNDNVSLILGDNIFYGDNVEELMNEAVSNRYGATIFGYPVPDPERFGVVGFDENMKVTSLEEKPSKPKSNYAAVGLYFYDNKVCSIAKTLKPSARGELEITDLNNVYLNNSELSVKLFDDKTKWIDAGTFDSLLESSTFIANEEKKKGSKILCPEIIAYRKGFVTKAQILDWVSKNKANEYFLKVKKEIENSQ